MSDHISEVMNMRCMENAPEGEDREIHREIDEILDPILEEHIIEMDEIYQEALGTFKDIQGIMEFMKDSSPEMVAKLADSATNLLKTALEASKSKSVQKINHSKLIPAKKQVTNNQQLLTEDRQPGGITMTRAEMMKQIREAKTQPN